MGHGRGMCRARDGTGCIIDAVIQHQWAVKWFRFHEQKFPPSTAQCVLLHSHGHWEGAAFAACLAGNAWPTTGCRVQRQQQLRDRKFGAQHQATGAACAQKAPACTYTRRYPQVCSALRCSVLACGSSRKELLTPRGVRPWQLLLVLARDFPSQQPQLSLGKSTGCSLQMLFACAAMHRVQPDLTAQVCADLGPVEHPPLSKPQPAPDPAAVPAPCLWGCPVPHCTTRMPCVGCAGGPTPALQPERGRGSPPLPHPCLCPFACGCHQAGKFSSPHVLHLLGRIRFPDYSRSQGVDGAASCHGAPHSAQLWGWGLGREETQTHKQRGMWQPLLPRKAHPWGIPPPPQTP